MTSRILRTLVAILVGVLPVTAQTWQKTPAIKILGKLPLSFEANSGQAGKDVKFLSRGSGYGLYLTGEEAALIFPRRGAAQNGAVAVVVRMRLKRANAGTKPVGEEPLPGTVNYFIGNDRAKWRTNIPTYGKVRYPGIYPGIDLVYYGNQQQLEYDFVAAPRVDPQPIRLEFSGAKSVRLIAKGNLALTTAHGTLLFRKPAAYQMIDGRRYPVAAEFAPLGRRTFGFRLGRYDHSQPLTIDPVLEYSTFLGGSGGSGASAIAVDGSGDVYLAGMASTGFPVTAGAFQTTDNGAANQVDNAFVTKLNPTGTALVYSTYLGGSGGDSGNGLAVDSAGNAYLTGSTYSTDFPVTQGAFQTTNAGTANQVSNAFITKLNPAGTVLVYSTYLGGSGISTPTTSGGDSASAIVVDATGDAFVAGTAYSANFPVTTGAFQKTNEAAANGTTNAFVSELNPAGTALVYSTYLGGSGIQYLGAHGDSATGLTVNSSGNAYVTGGASSTNFPVTSGAFQKTNHAEADQGANVFVSELNTAGTALVCSTYLGGSQSDVGKAIAVDATGNVYVAGATSSTDFPVTSGAFQNTNQYGFTTSGGNNAFIAKLNPLGSALVYSTYLGGSGGAINLSPTLVMAGGDQAAGLAIDSSGDAYVTGSTASANFPVTPGAFQPTNNDQTAQSIGGYNAFVTELNPAGSSLVYSTYLGGNGINPYDEVGAITFGNGDQASALALDSSDNVYITGSISSGDFPVTSAAFQTMVSSRGSAFAAKLDLASTSVLITPTVTVTPAKSIIASAQASTVTVSVSGGSGNPAPTGTITLSSGTYSSGAITLTGGSATVDIPSGALLAEPPESPSADTLSANYIPDAASSPIYNFSSGVSSIYVVAPDIAVNPSSATLTLAQAQSQPLPVLIGATSENSLPTPSGTVILTAGAYISPPATLIGGQATITIPAGTLTAGYDQVVVAYAGDGNYLPDGGSALVTVTPIGSDLSFWLDTSPITVAAGANTGNTSDVLILPKSDQVTGAVNLTCTVVTTPSNPTSPITCSIPSSVDITATEQEPTALLAVNSTATTTAGSYVVAITGVWGSVTEAAVVDVTITASTEPGFALSNSGDIPVSPGATTGNTSTISVTPSNGFTGTVNLSCAVTTSLTNPTAPATCSIPSSVSIAGTSAATTTLTVTTTAPTSALNRPRGLFLPSAGGAALALVLFFGLPVRRRRQLRFLGLVVLLLPLAVAGFGCGSSTKGGNQGGGGTTPGAYTVTVTGTDAATGKLTASTSVTVTVN